MEASGEASVAARDGIDHRGDAKDAKEEEAERSQEPAGRRRYKGAALRLTQAKGGSGLLRRGLRFPQGKPFATPQGKPFATPQGEEYNPGNKVPAYAKAPQKHPGRGRRAAAGRR
ncbi:MAG: hypothetical protein ACRD5M_13095 [Candidatus Acidiferrales bacterium]